MLKARAREITIIPKDIGTKVHHISFTFNFEGEGSVGTCNIHINLNCWCIDSTFPSEFVNSFAFIPNNDDMKERGRNMIVIMVNIMIARPCFTLSSARRRAALASIMLACCCFSSSRSLSYNVLAISIVKEL